MTTPMPIPLSTRQLTTSHDPYAPSNEDQARSQQMQTAWDAYRGRFRGGDEQWPLLWEKGKEPNPNIWINRCGPAVDTDVSWLFGESVSITVPKLPKAAQDYIDEAWGVSSDDSSDDDKMALLQELATNGAVTGHAFLKIVWDGDVNEDQEYPQLVVLDSQMVRVQTDPHNCKIPVCYIIEYSMPDPNSRSGELGTFRQVIQRVDPDGEYDTSGVPDDDTQWQIADYYRAPRASTFVLTDPPEGRSNPMMWEYTWPPIEGCPHIIQPGSYWGRPRITPDVIRVNEAICAVASNINKIGQRHGHPVLYTVKVGNNQRELRHKPGTILEVSSDVKAVEAHGDLANLMQFEEDLRADFDEETHVPAQAFGRQKDIPRTPVSGVAIRLAYGPLVADITKERRTYGALIRRVTQHMLELKNEAWKDAAVSLGWQDPLPADDLQAAQVVQAAVAVGVMSKATAANRLGLDWDDEQQNMQDEDQAQLDAFAKGQGMPPTPPAPAMPPMPGEPGQPAPAQPTAAPQSAPPMMHPQAVQARQAAQAAAGKRPTPGGL